jgi:5'-3' exonuclease
MPEIHLIDASPYVFRAYFSLPASMVDSEGRPSNAVHGYAGFLLRYLETEHPTHVAVAFDESLTSSFRNELYREYKAQRELPPADLEAQFDDCRALTEAMGMATFADERYEADDFIATLAHRFGGGGNRFVVVSPDKDLAQLVSESVTLHDFAKELRYGPEEIRAKFGVMPSQIADLLGLMGDAVDNIPGVKGIGPKTAVALLEAFGSLDSLLAGLDRVPALQIRGAKGVAEKLAASRAIAMLSRQLATVSTEAPAEVGLDALALRGPDPEKLGPLLARLGLGAVRRWAEGKRIEN